MKCKEIAMTRILVAAEIRILCAAAMQTVFKEVAPAFEQASGHKVVFAVEEGKIDPQRTVDIARVGVGMVVPTGTPKPTVTSMQPN
jgi:hypothetical protein